MNPTPETSVIVTCYNYGHYLKGCLGSILGQTYSDYEIIVIDDGSTDNTQEVMDSFTSLANLRYVRQPNAGQAKAKNRGIEAAMGRFVAFLDADDMWEKDKLEKQLPLFATDSVGVVYSRSRFVDDKGQILDYQSTGKYLLPRRGKVTDFLFIDNFVPFSSSIVRRQCFDQCGRFDDALKMGIDWDLWLRMSVVYEFDFVDEPLLVYRMGHVGQMSHNVEERQRCSDRIMKQFKSAFPGILSGESLRKAAYHTLCNRGEYYSTKDRLRSVRLFIQAIKVNPLERYAYTKIAKLLVKTLFASHRR